MPQVIIIARDPLVCQAAAQRHYPAGSDPVRKHCPGLDLSEIFNDVGTADLFATQRVYHYVDFLGLKLGPKQQERLSGILSSIPAEILLVCTQVMKYEKRADENRAMKGALLKTWSKNAPVEDLRNQSEGEQAVKWLDSWAREQYALNLNRGQLGRLLSACQDSPALADSELRKLWMLKDGDALQTISDAAIGEVLSTNPAVHFYEMVDAIMVGAPDWPARLEGWLHLEPEPHRLLNELKRRFLGLYDLATGQPVNPPFFAQQLRQFARQWQRPRLKAAITGLAELEHAMKSGKTTGETSVAGDISAVQVFLTGLLS